LLMPGRAGAELRGDLCIRRVAQALESGQMSREAVPHRRVRQRPPMALSHPYVEKLTPALQPRVHLWCRLVWEGAGRRAHRCRDVCHDPGIERLGLRPCLSRLRNVPYVARLHPGKGPLTPGEGDPQGALPPASRFEHPQRRRQLAEWHETLGDAGLVGGHTPARVRGTAGEVVC
jgi:hypothetical protein